MKFKAWHELSILFLLGAWVGSQLFTSHQSGKIRALEAELNSYKQTAAVWRKDEATRLNNIEDAIKGVEIKEDDYLFHFRNTKLTQGDTI